MSSAVAKVCTKHHLHTVHLISASYSRSFPALIDSGTNANFMNQAFAAELGLSSLLLFQFLKVTALDGCLLCTVTHYTSEVWLTFPDSHAEKINCHLFNSSQEVFNKAKATSLPPHQTNDCAIDLLPGTSPPKRRLYSVCSPVNVRPWMNMLTVLSRQESFVLLLHQPGKDSSLSLRRTCLSACLPVCTPSFLSHPVLNCCKRYSLSWT